MVDQEELYLLRSELERAVSYAKETRQEFIDRLHKSVELGLDDSGRLCGISKRISQRSLTEDIEFVDLEEEG